MSSKLLVSMAVLATFLCHVVTALPRLKTRQLASSLNFKSQNSNVCSNYMEGCIPWETKCCNTMLCLNVARGYCLYPMENCMCQQAYSDIF